MTHIGTFCHNNSPRASAEGTLGPTAAELGCAAKLPALTTAPLGLGEGPHGSSAAPHEPNTALSGLQAPLKPATAPYALTAAPPATTTAPRTPGG